MNFAKQYPKGNVMLVFIIGLFLSCAGTHTAVTVKSEPLINATFVGVQSVPPRDTVKKVSKGDSVEDILPKKAIDRLSKQSNEECDINKLRLLNIQWQEAYLRVLDSARSRKKDKDSLYTLFYAFRKETRDSISASRKENIANFKEARDARSLNTDTYNMFETLGTICFVIILLSYLIVGVVAAVKKFRKTPAL